jgi:hypothetical protein
MQEILTANLWRYLHSSVPSVSILVAFSFSVHSLSPRVRPVKMRLKNLKL